jgi:hypothetical protein
VHESENARSGRSRMSPERSLTVGKRKWRGDGGNVENAESARGIAPRAAHGTGLDTLASSGSCHRRLPPSIEHRAPPVAGWPAPMTMACSLRSTGITPLLSYYEAVRPSPAHRYFGLAVGAACAFSLTIAGQVLTFHTKASFAPPTRRMPLGQSQDILRARPGRRVTPRFRHRLIRFRRFCSGSLALASLDRACRDHRPDVSATFTTVAFDNSSLRWLGIGS